MRVSKSERQKNAKQFYSNLIIGYEGRVALVIKRSESTTNPNINRCQFLAATSISTTPNVIADSVDGIRGCFMELISFIDNKQQTKCYYGEDGFNEWLYDTLKFRIVYDDGFVIILKRNNE